jgi:hypothetical protein
MAVYHFRINRQQGDSFEVDFNITNKDYLQKAYQVNPTMTFNCNSINHAFMTTVAITLYLKEGGISSEDYTVNIYKQVATQNDPISRYTPVFGHDLNQEFLQLRSTPSSGDLFREVREGIQEGELASFIESGLHRYDKARSKFENDISEFFSPELYEYDFSVGRLIRYIHKYISPKDNDKSIEFLMSGLKFKASETGDQ